MLLYNIYMNKACFFDRDGIVNEMIFNKENGVITTPLNQNQIALVPGIAQLLQATKKLGFLNILISNQANIGLGRMDLKTHKLIQQTINEKLKQENIFFDKEYFCFHHPYAKLEEYRKECNCRKPKIGMLLQAQKDFDIDMKNSWMIGDGVFDVIAGHAAGCKTILVTNVNETGYLKIIEEKLENIKPDFMVKNIKAIEKIIL